MAAAVTELENRADWYRRRMRGEVVGPLERHRDNWARLVGETCGWPPEAGHKSFDDPRGPIAS